MATASVEEDENKASSSAPCKEEKDYCLLSEKNHQGTKMPAKLKKFSKMLSFSASSQDLIENERQDRSSPTGVIDAGEKCFGSPNSNSPKAECHHHHEVESSNPRPHSHWSRFSKLWKRRSNKRFNASNPAPEQKVEKLACDHRKSRSSRDSPELRDLFKFKASLDNFSISDLQHASNNFSPENIIGKGGFAEVYKGRLQNGKLVAIKRLSKGTADEKTALFLSELGILAHVDHPNTAKLLGCGIEGGMHLVFELSRLGSLKSVLHGPSEVKLDWSKRYKIALGTAQGLMYLHQHCQKRIIHRDIKADNILLTEDSEPQICDFGLAKWLPRQWTHHNVSKFEGTFGYFAPEYFMHGIVDEKTDIYAFGVLLLEIITGRPAVIDSRHSLVIWAKPLIDKNDIKAIVDPSLGEDYDVEEMEHVVLTASLCIQQSPILRPRMNQVVILLKGEDYAKQCTEQQIIGLQRTYSEELLDAQEYNSTKHLNQLKRYKEIALGS
ncbi:receptor-like cytosolic serine/threonine-protein kinase RBK2 [Euphorbia lathyris]|uniref:receptor-like cytosolic serine/threonine-protein kinase RBK2 n=1 Tax=Euphorbia lathyris TaxID=212925 RepID=UPI003313DD76